MARKSIYDLDEDIFLVVVCFGVPAVFVLGPILVIMLIQLLTTGQVNWV